MGVRYSTPKSAIRQPDDQTFDDSGTARYSCDSRLLNFGKINNKDCVNNSSPVQIPKNSPTMHRLGSSLIGNDSAIPSSAGSQLLSCKPNSNSYLDPMLYVNINSPGFVSRVVDSADQSANSTITGQSRFNGVGRFPRVQLGGPSPLPTLSSKNSQKFGKGTVHVRIAPPSSANQFERRRSSSCSDPDKSFKSVLESLQEKSRKRIYSQCQETEDYNIKKKQRKGEGSFTETNRDDQLYRLNRSSSVGSPSSAVLQIIDPVLQAKRAREEESPTEGLKRQKKRVVTYNNEILSSLSSSRGLLQRLSANKRKTAECDGSNTNALNKQFKENVDLSSPQSPPRWAPLKSFKENVVTPRSAVPITPESETRTPSRDEEAVMKLLDEEAETSRVLKQTPKKASRVSPKETDIPKITKKHEDVDMSSKLFRKNGTVKAKPRAAPASPWSHAAPAADELTCSLDKSGDKALERPQRFHGLLARMRGDDLLSTSGVSTIPTVASPLSKPAVTSSKPLSLSTPPSNTTDKRPSATPFTITSPSAAVVASSTSSLTVTSSVSSVSSTSALVSASATSIADFASGSNSPSSKSGFGGFSRSSTINTGSVASSLFGSHLITSQASPVALTSTTGCGARPVSSPTSSPKVPTSESGSAPASSPTTTASVSAAGSAAGSTTPSRVTFGSTSTTTVVNSTSNAAVTSSTAKTSSSSGFGIQVVATSVAPTFNFGAVAPAPSSTAASTTVVSTSTVSTLGSNEAAKPPAPSFQFGASNPSLPAGGVKFPGVTSAPTSTSTTSSTPSTSAPLTFTFGSNTSSASSNFGSATQPKSEGNPTTAAPTFGTGTVPTFGAATSPSSVRPTAAFGIASPQLATPSFGASSNAGVNFGSTTPAASSTPAFGSTSSVSPSTPGFGSLRTRNATGPATSSAAPMFGSTTPAPAFGATSATTIPAPAFGATSTTTIPAPAFGATSATTAHAPAFGATSSTTAPAPAFGATSSTTAPAPAFGATSATTIPAPAFGATSATTIPAPAFGATSATTIPAPAFGATSATAAPAPAFGATSATAAPAPAFGATSATTPVFGVPAASTAPNTNVPASTNGVPSFGSGAPAPAPTFGANLTPAFGSSAPSTSTPVFGAPATSTASNSAFQFGAASASQPTFNFSAGSSQNTPGSTQGFNFGASTGTRAFQFNANGASSSPAPGTPVTTAAPAFGASSATGSASGTAFGAPTFGATQTSAPSFGVSTSAFGAPQPGAMFGNASSQPSTSAFGGVPSFGSTAPSPAFGATPAPAFGSTPVATPSTPAFGATPAATPAAPSATPVFGAASTSTTTNGTAPAFQFGAPSAAPAPAFNFNAGSSQNPAGSSQGFNFNATPTAPTFQFNANGPTAAPAPGLLFGSADGSANAVGGLSFGSSVAPVPLGVFPMGAGMFHIGSGSSNPSQRPRQTARRRK